VDLRFNALRKLKLSNWIEEVDAAIAKAKQHVTKCSRQARELQKPAKSSLCVMIGAVRERNQRK
jgi:hypothetical protein